MGRTAAVTFEMVAAAAEAMKAEKLDVVTRAVRERLGNVGSMGTVNNHLQAWKARQEQHVTSALTLPPALQKSILDFMGVELANARSTLEAGLAAQQKEMADLANDNEKQFSELELTAETIDTLRNEIATLQGKSSQLEINLATSKDDLVRERENAEHARTELAKALLRLEAMPRLEADLNAARSALESEKTSSRVALDKVQAEKVAAEQSEAVAIAKLEAENQYTQELIKRLEAMPRLEADLSTVRAALDAERSAKVLAEQAAAVAMAKIESGNQRIQELVERLVKAEASNTKLQEKIDAAVKETSTLNSLVHAGQAKLEAATKEIEDLKKLEHTKVAKGKVGRPPKNPTQPELTDTTE